MLQPVYIVAFTGHRSADTPGRSPKELEACRPLIEKALKDLRNQIASVQGQLHLIASVAEGADTIALETAKELGIPIHILLPLPREQFQEDFDDRADTWPSSLSLIDYAERGENHSTLRLADSTLTRPECYAETNEQMLSSADALIALWNEEPAQGTGGTAQVWKAAEARKLARIHINPATQSVNCSDLDKLATPSDPSQSLFNSLAPHFPDLNTESKSANSSHSEICHQAMDEMANSAGHSSRSGTRISILLHGTASVLAAAAVSYALATGLSDLTKTILISVSVLEFFLILAAEIIHRSHHRSHTGEKWIQFRFAAELLRPYHLIHQHLDPFRPLIQLHYPQWRRLILSIVLVEPRQQIRDLEAAKQDYLSKRIIDQIKYFKEEQMKAAPKAKRIYRCMRLTSQSALIIVLIATIYKITHFPAPLIPVWTLEWILYLLPIALPLLAGILLALRQSLDIARRKLRYKHMENFLLQQKQKIAHSHTLHTFQSHVAKTEDTLLDELKEFQIAQSIGLEH